jgi:5-methylcytosine-specific restriction enzyme B
MDFTQVAARFVDECLIADGSLFLPGRPVWSGDHVEDLYHRFVEQPDESPNVSFTDKLRLQTADADPDVVLLAAEVLYLLLLPQATGGTTKRARVDAVLAGSPVLGAVPDDLASALDSGIASYGAALAQRFPQYVFLLEFARAWKHLRATDRDDQLGDPWRFREFVFTLPRKGASSQVEALLHMTFPGTFEPIVSVDVKQKIVETRPSMRRSLKSDRRWGLCTATDSGSTTRMCTCSGLGREAQAAITLGSCAGRTTWA